MPQMGESVAESTLTVWLKEIGDHVELDEPLFEITSDKVDAEVPSPATGILIERLIDVGTTVEVNTAVAIIEAKGEVLEDPPVEPAPGYTTPDHTSPKDPEETPQPDATSGVSRGTIAATKPSPESEVEDLRRTRSTPLVRRIAAEHGIGDLGEVPATGRGGRVTKQDILGFIEQGAPKKAAPTPSKSAAVPAARAGGSAGDSAGAAGPRMREVPGLPPVVQGGRDRVEMMAPQRLAIARHMVASLATSAHAHTVHEVDFGAVTKARKALRAEFEGRGVKLTYTAFMVQAFAEALVKFPVMNSSVMDDQIVYRGEVNVGVAVALEDSLIVPVVKGADELNLLGVARAIEELAGKARSKKLKPEDVKGGTFTVSNHGIFGPEFGIPVINQPQVAIVATGAIKKRVVVDQKTDAILIRPTATFCMSFDHRIVDGATADKFLMHVRERLEGWTA